MSVHLQPDDKVTLRSLAGQYGFDWIGVRIRGARIQANLSIREAADLAQISKNTLVRLEQGLPIHISSLEQICRALKVSARRLLAYDSEGSLIAVHKNSEVVWYDMNSFTTYQDSAELTPEQLASAGPESDFMPFYHLRSIRDRGGFQPFYIRLTKATDPKTHRGEELIFVTKGIVRLCLGDKSVEIGPHESALFFAGERHCYQPVGDVVPEFFCMIFSPGERGMPPEQES